ncbi:ankyrin repeat domain-containing protein [Cardinium endosymbiont of Culicoides punctatus]|uniref:ankyrin repeat domain-containing protein n=1 Tax=Cardinium endosymbiont of Culicoides punctatus TaxID=2304601 RepID=UPI001058B3CD|nr:ankyrin repeat domain-containing protein [Cardinium endosymbiont of Culicoides punctatus]TDG95729.1 hypothetical protein CCPUN_00130 [Cardinium endosymbiont of Culicoides punctatus]
MTTRSFLYNIIAVVLYACTVSCNQSSTLSVKLKKPIIKQKERIVNLKKQNEHKIIIVKKTKTDSFPLLSILDRIKKHDYKTLADSIVLSHKSKNGNYDHNDIIRLLKQMLATDHYLVVLQLIIDYKSNYTSNGHCNNIEKDDSVVLKEIREVIKYLKSYKISSDNFKEIYLQDLYIIYSKIVKEILSHKDINPNIRINNEQDTLLHMAVKQGKKDTVEILLSIESINTDLTDKQRNTPLHIAAGKDNIEIIRILLKAGAKQVIYNNKGELAIDMCTPSLEFENLFSSTKKQEVTHQLYQANLLKFLNIQPIFQFKR